MFHTLFSGRIAVGFKCALQYLRVGFFSGGSCVIASRDAFVR
jgi:hypothetical protein